MKTIHSIYTAIAALCFTVSCTNNATPEISVENQEIRFMAIHPASLSRVTDTSFETGDKIGVYMVDAGEQLQLGGNELNNEPFIYNGNYWTSIRTTYWNEGNHDVYAYYPYSSEVDATDNYTFYVSTDQSTVNEDGITGYEMSDFLWASAKNVQASAEPVTLTFSHCMSKVNVVLQKSSDYTGDIPSNCEVYLHNFRHAGLVNLQTGTVEANPYLPVMSVKCRKISDTEFTACIVPQRISSRRPIVEVVTDHISYLLDGTVSLKQGYSTTIVVTLTQSPEQVEIEIGGGVGNWN